MTEKSTIIGFSSFRGFRLGCFLGLAKGIHDLLPFMYVSMVMPESRYEKDNASLQSEQ